MKSDLSAWSDKIASLHVGETISIPTPECVVKRDGHTFFSIETKTLLIFNLTQKTVLEKLERGLAYHTADHDIDFFNALHSSSE